MRNPQISNRRIPRQRAVGLKVASVLAMVLHGESNIGRRVLDSIGEPKDQLCPPTSAQVDRARAAVLQTLGVSHQWIGPRRTELHGEIFEAWVDQAGDPETEVPRWLKDSGPAGIERDPGAVGIFPQVTA